MDASPGPTSQRMDPGLPPPRLTRNSLTVLNLCAHPVWVYSCSSQRLIWANRATLQYFDRSLEAFLSFRFASPKLSGQDLLTYQLHNTLVLDEVENGGTEQIVLGAGHNVLPGVPPHDNLQLCEFLYKQLPLATSEADTKMYTQVQLVRSPATSVAPPDLSVIVQTIPTPLQKAGAKRYQRSLSLQVPSLVEVFDSILSGKAVDRSCLESLQQSILRGEIAAQPPRFEDELVLSKAELEEDVGLNLLQLLGCTKLGDNYSKAPPPSPSPDSLTPASLSIFASALSSSSSSSDRHGDPAHPGPASALATSGGSGRFGDPDHPHNTSSSNGNLRRLASIQSDDSTGCGGLWDGDCRDSGGGNPAHVPCSVPGSLTPAMEASLGKVDEWRFDAFELSDATQGHPLSALSFWLLQRSSIISTFELDPARLARFLRRVEDGYPDNPYHNRTHAADVLQGMHCLLTRGGLHRRLGEDPLAMFAGYLAAVLHDHEHKGLNNDFLVRVGDELAVTYNDVSPMENHHAASAFKLMRHKDYSFMRRMPQDKWVRLRRLLIEMVLATDMKQHFNILSKFQAKMQDDADKSLILQVGLKCADVGHLAAPWDVHRRWVSGLEEEFFRQGDREKKLQMLVSPLMDRSKDGISKSQNGFFDIVALPLFYSWASVFQDALPLVRAVEENCNIWKTLDSTRTATASSK
ncbi:MAG: hypothetical protein WDW38_004274 [Sanguina aurantia]